MSMTFCKINVKHVKDNKWIKIKYKLNKQTSVYTSYTARNRWVFNSLIHWYNTHHLVLFIAGELSGGVREDAHHLGTVATEQTRQPLSCDHMTHRR